MNHYRKLIDEKYIYVRKHPDAELYIYNYSPKTQYDRKWNEITMICRGLIRDEKQIIARPFNKFFNIEQHEPEEITNEEFEVYEKLDGSLGILYWLSMHQKLLRKSSKSFHLFFGHRHQLQSPFS